MALIFRLLATVTSIYLLLIFIRIMLTWFGGVQFGRSMAVLSAITDPYLDWFRRFPGLQIGGFLDLSPIVAMAVLSVLNNIFMMIAQYGYISIGIVLSIVLSAIWSAASFILGFITIVLLLRFFAYITSQNTFSPFWRIIDAISRPILYRLNRIFFRKRLVNYKTEIIMAVAIFAGLWVGIGLLVKIAGHFLTRLPI